MKNFDKPILPASAETYSLQTNVSNAILAAKRAEPLQILTMMQEFLNGMPEATGEARVLSSTASHGETESPLFDKVFHVPLPLDEDKEVTVDGVRPLELLTALGKADSLPGPYKTDIVVFDHPDRGTLKITKWHQDDPRGEVPHNHPWCDKDGVSFMSYIVRGGYDEVITNPDGSTRKTSFRAGMVNTSHYEEFHTVSNILPGTLTILMCAPRAVVERKGYEWGYMLHVDEEAEYVPLNDPRVADTTFLQRAAVQNSNLRFIYKK